MTTLNEYLQTQSKSTIQRLWQQFFNNTLGNSRCGVEIECFGKTPQVDATYIMNRLTLADMNSSVHSHTNVTTAPRVWSVTTDGSIRIFNCPEGGDKSNPDYIGTRMPNGMELVSPPMRIQDLYQDLKRLDTVFFTNLETNPTCSTHVHHSVESCGPKEREAIFLLYQHLEPQLDRMLPAWRTNNRFRGGESYCGSVKAINYTGAGTTEKYFSLRVTSNTFEFRKYGEYQGSLATLVWVGITHMIVKYGSDNWEKILKWAKKGGKYMPHLFTVLGESGELFTNLLAMGYVQACNDLSKSPFPYYERQEIASAPVAPVATPTDQPSSIRYLRAGETLFSMETSEELILARKMKPVYDPQTEEQIGWRHPRKKVK